MNLKNVLQWIAVMSLASLVGCGGGGSDSSGGITGQWNLQYDNMNYVMNLASKPDGSLSGTLTPYIGGAYGPPQTLTGCKQPDGSVILTNNISSDGSCVVYSLRVKGDDGIIGQAVYDHTGYSPVTWDVSGTRVPDVATDSTNGLSLTITSQTWTKDDPPYWSVSAQGTVSGNVGAVILVDHITGETFVVNGWSSGSSGTYAGDNPSFTRGSDQPEQTTWTLEAHELDPAANIGIFLVTAPTGSASGPEVVLSRPW